MTRETMKTQKGDSRHREKDRSTQDGNEKAL